MTVPKEIFVFADWNKNQEPMLVGIVHVEVIRGKEIFSFEYDQNWLKSSNAQQIDPELQLYSGLHYLNSEKRTNFGIFLDSSPDRWGRILMRRKEAVSAKIERREERTFLETDYLLGISDYQRMGALRFKTDLDGPFPNDNTKMPTPPWTSLRQLESISLRIENDEVVDDPHYIDWLNILLAPGSSLGGARPKAGVLSPDGHLWIAKFPSRNDRDDVGGWEMVAHDLAVASGITIAESKVQRFTDTNHTFMTKRFDRGNEGERIHFASAMTMLGYNDGDSYAEGVSYLEIAEFLTTSGAETDTDLEELWRRIVFNIAISNTDDHLRNHGFILTNTGWRLSPAFDINPIEYGTGLKLNISENDNSLDFELAMDVCKYFRLSEKRALEIMSQVKESTKNWRILASKYGISNSEQQLKAKAFKF